MNKILITLCVPVIEEEYDIYLPVSKSVKIATELIVKSINEILEGQFPIEKKYVLMTSTGQILNDSSTIKQLKIKNGDRLVLI